MDEPQKRRGPTSQVSRIADFILGVPLILIGAVFLIAPFAKPGPDDGISIIIGAVPVIMGTWLMFRGRLTPPGP